MRIVEKNRLKKKPPFVRQDSNKKRFKSTWRWPRGLHSKLRLRRKGNGKVPDIGYGTPQALKNKNKRGNEEILIHTLNDLTLVNEGKEALISSKMGLKNKIIILEECKKRKIFVSNIKDIDTFIQKVRKEQDEKRKKKGKKEEIKPDRKEPIKETQEEIKQEILESPIKSKPKPHTETTLKSKKIDIEDIKVMPEEKK